MIASACVRFHTKSKVVTGLTTQPSRTYTIPCHRHCDAFYIISQFLNSAELDKSATEQGFLTEGGEFLNRYDAMIDAVNSGQLPPSAKEKCAELYSEDLW